MLGETDKNDDTQLELSSVYSQKLYVINDL